MRKKLACLFFVLVLVEFAALGVNDDKDVDLDYLITNQVTKLTDSQKERNNRLNALDLPYKGNPQAVYGTLGQLCKLCDIVVVGRIREVRLKGAVSGGLQVNVVEFTQDVSTNIFGHFVNSPVSYTTWSGVGMTWPQKGTRVVAFLSEETNPVPYFNSLEWSFDKAKVHGKSGKEYQLVGQMCGILTLDPVTETEILSTVSETLQHLRLANRNADNYYAFLRRLIRSPIRRIKEDARSDLMNFLRTCPSLDLNRVLADEDIDYAIKDYIRLVLLPFLQSNKVP